jgi:hypothetical protein
MKIRDVPCIIGFEIVALKYPAYFPIQKVKLS